MNLSFIKSYKQVRPRTLLGGNNLDILGKAGKELLAKISPECDAFTIFLEVIVLLSIVLAN